MDRFAKSSLPIVVTLLGSAIACSSTPQPSTPEPSDCDAPRAPEQTPAWTHADPNHAPSRVLPPPTTQAMASHPPRETVHIQAPPRVDPVDRVLSRKRRRIKNLSLHQAPVDDTLRMFATMGGFNVVIPGEVAGRKVSLELRNVSLAGAFRAVLASSRLEARVLSGDILEVRAAAAR